MVTMKRDRCQPRQILLRTEVQRALARSILGNLPLDSDNPIEILIREQPKKRSSQANRYYWQVLHQIEEQAWVEGRQYSADCWHEAAKRRILGLIDLPRGGAMAIR